MKLFKRGTEQATVERHIRAERREFDGFELADLSYQKGRNVLEEYVGADKLSDVFGGDYESDPKFRGLASEIGGTDFRYFDFSGLKFYRDWAGEDYTGVTKSLGEKLPYLLDVFGGNPSGLSDVIRMVNSNFMSAREPGKRIFRDLDKWAAHLGGDVEKYRRMINEVTEYAKSDRGDASGRVAEITEHLESYA
jgi:hypothetical protein